MFMLWRIKLSFNKNLLDEGLHKAPVGFRFAEISDVRLAVQHTAARRVGAFQRLACGRAPSLRDVHAGKVMQLSFIWPCRQHGLTNIAIGAQIFKPLSPTSKHSWRAFVAPWKAALALVSGI